MIYLRRCPIEKCGKYRKHGEWIKVEDDMQEIIEHKEDQRVVFVKKDMLCPDCQKEAENAKRDKATLP